MAQLTLPAGVTSHYTYDAAGRLTLLAHSGITQTLASYAYRLDGVGNRQVLTESLLIPAPVIAVGNYLEENGQLVMEAEAGQPIAGDSHNWQLKSTQSGYTGTGYLQALPDTGVLYQNATGTGSAALQYPINFTTPGTYTVWLRGLASDAASDSAYVGWDAPQGTVTGFAPGVWDWASGVTLTVQHSGTYTLSVWLREDGLRLDRLLLTTDPTYLPSGFGPPESARQTGATTATLTTLARTIDYGYDGLYRLTGADYTTGEQYGYAYDPVGNRLQQIIGGNTTEYLYDAANRLASVDGVSYTFDANGNLLQTDSMTNIWDAANRLATAVRAGNVVQPIYNSIGDRVAEVSNGITTTFALDIQGLPEVIYTSAGETTLHLPGVIVTESSSGEMRYLLSDGLGSVRQAVGENGTVITYNEYDPYGNPTFHSSLFTHHYGYTGEWWQDDLNLLYLRARWYAPETGTFLSVDSVESEPPYAYVGGNVVNRVDPSGELGICFSGSPNPVPANPKAKLIGNKLRKFDVCQI